MNDSDIIVIGAGPAGMAAATLAAEHGARVTLLDENASPGGQIYRGVAQCNEQTASILGKDYQYGATLTKALYQSTATTIGNATVWAVDKHGLVTYSRHGKAYSLKAALVILATGAIERPCLIPGWTLPGAMTAGAAQILFKRSTIIPDNTIFAGTGPLLYTVANQLLNAGANITAIVDTIQPANYRRAVKYFPFNHIQPILTGLRYLRRIKQSNIPFFQGASQLSIEGKNATTGISFYYKGKVQRIASQSVLLHQGVIPNTQLSRSLGLEHRWHAQQRCFHPLLDNYGVSSNPLIRIAGDGAAIHGAIGAEHQGRIVACGALETLGIIDQQRRDQLSSTAQRALKKQSRLRRFLDVLYSPPTEYIVPQDSVTVCRCEEINAGEIRQMAELGCHGPNQTKSLSRCGMGPCQGRYCGLSVTEILATHHGKTQDEIGAYRIRTPIKPVTLAELASLDS